MGKPVVACVVGTRPDAIKSAPVILELAKYKDELSNVVISTGQHREMLDQVFDSFGFRPDVDLQVMSHGQRLEEMAAKILTGLATAFDEVVPDYVIAQGDTSTTFIASLAAFYRQIPFGHVEAGLRTDTITNPFPEEFNRRATGLIATHHFAPTAWAANNLKSEGKPPDSIYVTGNTGIDAILEITKKSETSWFPEHQGRIILLTTHRRENWGEPQHEIAKAALEILELFEDCLLVVPMHRNPDVRAVLKEVLGGHPRARLIEPPEYERFVQLMKQSHIILTDSGGVQEEAPAFGVPVLVLRDTTERPEGVIAGTAKLVGTDFSTIVRETSSLLADKSHHDSMAHAVSPYGDGKAAERVASIVMKFLGIEVVEVPMWA